MPTKIRGVFFDLGGTLIHFQGTWTEVMHTANEELLAYLQQAGFSVDEATFTDEFKRRLEEYYVQRESEFIEYTTNLVLRTLLQDLGNPQVEAEALRPALKRLYAVSQAHWQREDDALATLQDLKASGYKLGIISNAGDDEDVQTLVDNAGIRGYFEFVLSSASCGVRKPNPRIFELALEKLNLRPDEAAMVGDTLGADILGARNAGLKSIWITRRADTPDNHDHDDTIQPDKTIATLTELPAALRSLS
jgi:2-haloalkanoic acid dehalogenase type II